MNIAPIGFKPNYIIRKNINTNHFLLKTSEHDTVHFGNAKKVDNIQKVIFLMGPPNSGKGTLSKIIAAKYNIPTISVGNLLRNERKQNPGFENKYGKVIDSGRIVPEQVTHDLLVKRTLEPDCRNGYILDGCPRTVEQAEMLDEYYKNNPNIKLAVLKLDIPDEILYERCAKRFVCADCDSTYSIDPKIKEKEHKTCTSCGGELIKRGDDKPETLSRRLDTYNNTTKLVYEHYKKQGLTNDYYIASNDIKPNDVFISCSTLFSDLFGGDTNN